MEQRVSLLWLSLLSLCGAMGLLYLWATLYSGNIPAEVYQYFTWEEVTRGKQYSGPLRVAYIAGIIVQVILLWGLAFGKIGYRIEQWAWGRSGGNYWLGVLLFSFSLWLILQLADLPLAYFSGYYWQHQWGFSTQSLGAWSIDLLKGAGISCPLFLLGLMFVFFMFNRWPRSGWFLCAGALSLWFVVQILIWPLLVTPLFNRIEPVRDPQIIEMVETLSQKAGVSIKAVGVMDASTRTTKANAYFTGLGRTKQIVLYDNLLAQYSLPEVKAVLAHEMSHWIQGHVWKGLLWATLANFLLWGLLFLILGSSWRSGNYMLLQTAAAILLFAQLCLFIGNPISNRISRTMEIEADVMAARLTGEVSEAVQLEVNLAVRNLADLTPPPFIEWFSYGHPSVLKRIKAIEGAIVE